MTLDRDCFTSQKGKRMFCCTSPKIISYLRKYDAMSDSYDSLMRAFGYHPQNPKPKQYDRGLAVANLAERQCFFTGSSCMTCLSAIPEYPPRVTLGT